MTDTPTVEGRAETPRAERYLAQLVDHLTQLGQHSQGHEHRQHGTVAAGAGGHEGPPVVRHIERTDGHARIEFDWGRFHLTATATELILEVHAGDPHALTRGQALIAHRVETIGRRDQLTVGWQPTGT